MSLATAPARPRSAPLPAPVPEPPAAGPRDRVPAAASTAHPAPAVELDALTQQPRPLRFPWLNRLSKELEPAAPQKPAFATAPVLGDSVDRSA